MAGFLTVWNWKTYKNEYDQLKKSLDYQLQLTQGEIRDSILFTFVNMTRDSFPNQQLTIDTINYQSHFSSMTAIVDLEQNSTHSDLKIIQSPESFKVQTNDPCFDASSIKLDGERIITILRDTIREISKSDQKVTTRLVEKLDNEGLPIQFEIAFVQDSIERKQLSLPFQKNPFDESQSEIVFSNYKWYLVKKVLPSFLFSLVLFSLVCITFWTLYHSKMKQQRIMAIKNEFVSNMTHELKTPISTISVALEAMTGFGIDQDPKRTREYIDISKHELKRLNILVDKVLKMSSFENDEVPMNMEKIELKGLIENIQNSMQLHLENNRVNLKFEANKDEFFVDADAVHLTNVLYNLIDNAIKYSDENPAIKITLQDLGRTIEIRIQDEGIGIPKEYQDKIFDRFFRVPSNDRHNVKGYGLGLHYVHKIIKRHHGNITLKSELNQGTEFIIEFPKA